MEGIEDVDLEVDSVVDLRVLLNDESEQVEAVEEWQVLRYIAGSSAGSFWEAKAQAPVMADTWCRWLSHTSSTAGTDEHYEHALRTAGVP